MADERPPPLTHRRCRRRGPRSLLAISQRNRHPCRSQRQPQDSGLCQSRPELSFNTSFSLLHLNIRCFNSHRPELQAHILHHQSPTLIGITETWLDASTDKISLPGYSSVSRLDRRDGRQRGGIALFARDDSVPLLYMSWISLVMSVLDAFFIVVRAFC